MRKCERCGNEEFRIDGFCSVYCRDMHDVETELAEAKSPPPTKAIVLEGELELHADYEGEQIYLSGKDLWNLLADTLAEKSRRNEYESLYGPVRITIQPLEGEGDE